MLSHVRNGLSLLPTVVHLVTSSPPGIDLRNEGKHHEQKQQSHVIYGAENKEKHRNI